VGAYGVETVAAAKTLLSLGCSRAQGFLLSRPLDNAAMESLLARRVIPINLSNATVSPPKGKPGRKDVG
jgi:predicted signal transduction protein with EAL and GGDEF domain